MQYARNWRILHWVIALCVMSLVPIGLLIEARTEANLWDDFTNLLYSIHKSLGFSVLLLMLLRLAFKLYYKAPAYPNSLPKKQILLAKSLHHLLYGLLFLVPLLGWAGVTAFPALEIIPGVRLPAMPGIPSDEALAARLFSIHGSFAIILAVLVLGHIGAALHHLFIKKDTIFARMWFKK